MPESVSVITDPGSGRSRGFAFVEMNDPEADKAVAALNGTDLRGRSLNVNEARPKREGGGRDRERGGRDRY
jgi:RNA recognition motif-containing protein